MHTALTFECVLPVRIRETIHGETRDACIPTPSTSVGTTASGITDPVEYWDPSPALSGMTFYTGDAFPAWQKDLFTGPSLSRRSCGLSSANTTKSPVRRSCSARGSAAFGTCRWARTGMSTF